MTEVNSVLPDGTGPETPLQATWRLTTPNTDSEGLRYRRSFTLDLPTGGVAEEMIIDPVSNLKFVARPIIFDALSNTVPEKAAVAPAESGLRVTLPLPRLIYSIRFASNVSPGGKTTQLFRTDGDVISEQPVASRLNPNVALLNFQPDSEPISTAQEFLDFVPVQIVQAPDFLLDHQIFDNGELGVVDGQVVVRLKDADFEALNSNSLTQFNIRTEPENFRFSIRLPELSDDMFALSTEVAAHSQVDVSTALLEQLNDLLKRLIDQLAADTIKPAILPDPLQVELIAESDAPCEFTINPFSLRFRLARQSFPQGEEKQVLKFAAGRLDSRTVAFEIPSMGNILKASIAVAGTPADSNPDTISAVSSGNASKLATPGDSGLRLDQQHRWSTPLQLAAPTLVNGIDVLLTSLSQDCRISLFISADQGGRPAGERLAQSAGDLALPGKAELRRFQFGDRLLLQPGIYWIFLESLNGSAVWHLQEHLGLSSLQWGEAESAIPDQVGIANWVAVEGSAAADNAIPEITLDGQTLQASREKDDWVYDLMPALGNQNSVDGNLISREVKMHRTGPASATVYPPRLEFEV